jgi:hypothetical protein
VPVRSFATERTSLTSANPPVNFNKYFRLFSDPTYVWDAALSQYVLPPSTFFNVTPDIAAAPAPITPTPWSNPPPDFVTPRNDHVAVPLSGVGGGGPPIDLGSWNVANGVITADPCPVGVACGAAITGAGFYQREVTRADGSKYFQTIITDGTASGNPHTAPAYTGTAPTYFNMGALAFATESFVSPGSTGLSSRTQMLDVTTGKDELGFTVSMPMAYSTVLNNGWAQGSGAMPVLQIKEIVGFGGTTTMGSMAGAPTFAGNYLGTQFDMTVAANGAKDYTIISVPYQNPKPSVFYTRVIEGGVQTSSHALTDPLLVPGGTNGGNISWTAGDSLQAMYLGTGYGDPSPTFAGNGVTRLGVVAYTNLTTGARTSLGTAIGPPSIMNPPAPLVVPFAAPAPPSVSMTTGNVIWPGQSLAW